MLSLNTQLTDFYLDASCCENCLSVTCMLPQPWLAHTAWQWDSIITLSCSVRTISSMEFQSNHYFLFRARLPPLFLDSTKLAMPLLIGYESFMGFWPFCLSQGILMPKISEIYSHFLQPTAFFLPAALLNGCTMLGRSPVIFWHDKMDYTLRLLF